MKYTTSAIGLLTRQYRAVLKKCFLMNWLTLFSPLAKQWAGDVAERNREGEHWLEKCFSHPHPASPLSSFAATICRSLGGGDTKRASVPLYVYCTFSRCHNGVDTTRESVPPYEKHLSVANESEGGTIGGWQKSFIRFTSASLAAILIATPLYAQEQITSKQLIKDGETASFSNVDFSHFSINWNNDNVPMPVKSWDRISINGGGIIENYGTINSISNAAFVDNNISIDINRPTGWDAYYTLNGAMIYNATSIQNISNVIFKNNEINAYNNESGQNFLSGAIIKNNGGSIGNITNIELAYNVIRNRGTGSDFYIDGGFLDNSGSVGKIIGSFNNNTIIRHSSGGNPWMRGGFIYNHDVGEISEIAVNFINNTVTGEPDESKLCSWSYIPGALVLNNSNSTITKITGNFENNLASIKADNGAQIDGLIKNSGQITAVENVIFDNNKVISDSGNGGYSAARGTISNEGEINLISGIFTDNDVIANGGNAVIAQGGVIHNFGGTIDTIKGFFDNNKITINNEIENLSAQAQGGAIFNNSKIHKISNSSFLNNKVIANVTTNNLSAWGGAIYSSTDLNVMSDGEKSVFKGNSVTVNGEVDDNAIYVDSSTATLTFDAKNNGEIFMYDNINGVEKTTTDEETGEETTTRYKVNITGDGTGTMHLYNDIKKADVTVSNTTLDIGTSAVNTKNITFTPDSALVLKVNALDDHGSLTAENIAVDEGAKLKATLAQGIVGFNQEEKIQLLSAENEDFNNFADEFDNNMYQFEKADKNGAYNISLVKTAEDVAEAAGAEPWAAEAAGAYVDGEKFAENTVSADVANKLADLAQNDATSFVEAVKTLAPTETAVVQAQSTEEASRLFKNVGAYLRGEHSPTGFASGDDLDGVSVWGKAYIGESKISRRGTIAGSEADSKGFIIGLEKKLNKEVKIGAGVQYDNTDVDAYRRDMDVNSVMGFAYGEYKPSNWFVNGVLSYGGSKYDEKKYALGTHYDAKYDAHIASATAMTGYQYGIFTPEAGLRYYHIKQSGYTDTAGQNVEGDKSDILRGVAGVRMAKDFGQFRPEAYLGITYDLASDKGNTTVNLANGSSYTVQGKRLDKLGYEASLSFAATLSDNITASVSYLGAYRDNYREHTGMLNVKYAF